MCHFIPQSSLSQNLVEEMKQTSPNACAILSSSTTTENDQKSTFLWHKYGSAGPCEDDDEHHHHHHHSPPPRRSTQHYKQSLQAHASLSIYVSEKIDIKCDFSKCFSFIVWSLVLPTIYPNPLSLGFRVPTRFGGKVSADAIWSLKGIKGSHLSTFVAFFHQKVLITFQTIQSSSILS